MVLRRLIVAVAVVVAMGGAAGAVESGPPQCSLGTREFSRSVKPLYNYEDAGYTAFRQFVGAEVFVAAEPGLTAEWLDRVITSDIATGQCDLGVPRVDVQVLPAGGGFSVRLSADSEKGAAEVLRHAQQLVKRLPAISPRPGSP
jgi:hypothetical protein